MKIRWIMFVDTSGWETVVNGITDLAVPIHDRI